MTSHGHPSNEFWNHGRIANQVGQQNVQGDVHIHQNLSDDPSHLLSLLPSVPQAAFNSYESQHDPTCLRDTRVNILKQIGAWADGSDDKHIFWLNGMAGMGKSTIARTVARRYDDRDCLGASFFFSRDQQDRRHAGKLLTSIATQLAKQNSLLKECICEAVAEYRDIAHHSLHDQWRRLILRPLGKLEAITPQILMVVIDALDECENENDVREIIQLFAEAKILGKGKGRLRLFLTSRPDTPIRRAFGEIPEDQHHDLVLHSISSFLIEQDLETYFRYELKALGGSEQWPSESDVARLVERAGGLFIWAATACRFIKDGKGLASRRLALILDGNSARKGSEKKLDEIYTTILVQSVSGDYDDQDKEELLVLFREIVGSIVILFDPLPTAVLARLLSKPKEEVDQTLNDLYSVLEVPQDQGSPIRLVHPSFHDFLLSKERCVNAHFWVDERKTHHSMFVGCIALMSKTLKQDLCNLRRPGARAAEVDGKWKDEHLPWELRYACRYWVEHLRRSKVNLAEDGRVHAFFQEHLLHWLEALGLMQAASEAVRMMTILQSLVTPDGNPELHALIHDARRFVLYNRWIVDEAPLQTYCSALVFAPHRSLTRQLFRSEMAGWMRVLPKAQEDWSPLLQTLEGHTRSVEAVTFSPNGQLLASASEDNTIRLWDVATGVLQSSLEGHTNMVSAVAFSPNDQLLASASSDKTVRLWDTATRVLQSSLEGHRNEVKAVAFSPNGQLLASASWDKTIRLWDAVTGVLQSSLEGHTDWVNAVTFSPNGQLLASVSSDKTVRLWDAATGVLQCSLEGHTGWVSAVAFSPNGQLLASASWDQTVGLWDAATGVLQCSLEGHIDGVTAVAFSPNGQLLASVSSDKTVRLWDAATGVLQCSLEGHTGWVSAVAFSPNGQLLASASWDKTIRLWDAATGVLQSSLEGHTNGVNAVTFSPNGQLLASASWDKTVGLWDAATGVLQSSLEGHTYRVSAVTFSPNGQLLASASYDKTVRLWDAATGVLQCSLEGHTSWVNAVAFSPNGQLLASASNDKTVRLWDVEKREAVHEIPTDEPINNLSFSVDGSHLKTDRGSIDISCFSLDVGQPHLEYPLCLMVEALYMKETQQDAWAGLGNRYRLTESLGLESFEYLSFRNQYDNIVLDFDLLRQYQFLYRKPFDSRTTLQIVLDERAHRTLAADKTTGKTTKPGTFFIGSENEDAFASLLRNVDIGSHSRLHVL